MPFFDLTCSEGHEQRNLWLKVGERPPCPLCGKPTETLWDQSSSVVGDEIPGGILMEHGLCNEDGSPRRYYSKSEMAKVAQERELINFVRHQPGRGTDKSRNTVRWVSVSPISEEQRVKEWWEHERKLQEEASQEASRPEGSVVDAAGVVQRTKVEAA